VEKEGRAEIVGEKSEIPCKADDVASAPVPVSCKDYFDMLQGSIDRVYKPMIFGVTDLFQPVPGLADDPADPSGKNQILSAWGLGPGFYQKLPRCRGGHAEGDTADHSKIALPGPQVGFRAPQGMKHIIEDEGVIIKFRPTCEGVLEVVKARFSRLIGKHKGAITNGHETEGVEHRFLIVDFVASQLFPITR